MYPHRIRLRDPWDYEPLANDRARFTRRFGYPGRIDADERVWLTCAGWTGRADLLLNGSVLARDQDGARPFECDVTALLRPRNQVVFEIAGTGARADLCGEVALEIRSLAFLQHASARPVLVDGRLELEVCGTVTGSAESELDLYAILNGRQAVYGRVKPAATGQAFCLRSAGLEAECWQAENEATETASVRIDLVKGAMVWYTVHQNLTLVPTPGAEH